MDRAPYYSQEEENGKEAERFGGEARGSVADNVNLAEEQSRGIDGAETKRVNGGEAEEESRVMALMKVWVTACKMGVAQELDQQYPKASDKEVEEDTRVAQERARKRRQAKWEETLKTAGATLSRGQTEVSETLTESEHDTGGEVEGAYKKGVALESVSNQELEEHIRKALELE